MDIPVFDAHCDTIIRVELENRGMRKSGAQTDLTRGGKYKPYAQVFAVGFSMTLDLSCLLPYDVLLSNSNTLLSLMLSEFEKNADILTLCRNAGDIKAAADSGKIAALIAVEGTELLGCDIDRLKEFYDKGARLVNLCWNFDNEVCGSSTGKNRGGLTEKGKEFIRTMQEMGIAVDLSHASEKTFWDVVEMTKRPIMAGHSDSAYECPHTRNLTDEQFNEIVKLKGAVGLNLYPAFLNKSGEASIDDVVRHAEHFLSLGGEKPLCLGGDLDGMDRMTNGITGIESYADIYEAMLKKNFPENLVRDIFYNNLFEAIGRMI
jgi:membrane dipeptidase